MRNWGRFKSEGSIIAVAMGAIAAGILTEEDIFGPEPERPRLSDPDSDALYGKAVAIDNDASQPSAQGQDDLPRGRELTETSPDIQPDTPSFRHTGRRGSATPAMTRLTRPDLPALAQTASMPQGANGPDIALAAGKDDPSGQGASPKPSSLPDLGESATTPPASAAAVAQPLPPAPTIPAIEPEATAISGATVPQAATPTALPPPAAPTIARVPESATAPAPAIAFASGTEKANPVAADPVMQDRPVVEAAPPPQPLLQEKPAAPSLQAAPAVGRTATKSAAARSAEPASKPKPAARARISRSTKTAPAAAARAGRADPAQSQAPLSLADIRARLGSRTETPAKSATPAPATTEPRQSLTLADIRSRLDRASAPKPENDALVATPPPPGTSAPTIGRPSILVPGLTTVAQQEGGPALGEMLALAPIVNNGPVDTIITVERLAGGGFRVRAGDLRALRVILDPAIRDDDYVTLATLPGVEARYVEASQSLALTVPDALLQPTLIDARGGRKPVDLSKVVTTSGLLFNYRLLGTIQRGDGRDVQLTGDTEFVGMTPLGLLVTNGTFATGGRRSFVRGDSFFRYEDIARVRSLTIGDFATGALGFSRSVRLGGIQFQSDFQQRPDIFLGPLPQFAGSAALPSALDLYADNVKVFSSNIPQGPFILRSLPQISGNELRIVTTDATGRQTEITTPYFDAPGLLRKGVLEYSAELGAPRINAGIRSFDYRSQLFGSATARYGLGNRLTVEGHLEAGGDLANGGLGIIQALGPLGSLTAAGSLSTFRGKQGARLLGQYRLDLNRFSLFASVEREYGRYLDLGDISSLRGRVTDPTGADLFPRRAKRSLERIGASFRPSFDPVSFNIAYNHLRFGDSEIRTANFAVRRRITNRISFRGDALFDLKRRGDVALSAGLDIRLGRNTSAFAGADRTDGRTNYSVSVNGFSDGRQNALGYSLAQRGNDDGDAFRSASLNYRLPQAFVAGSIDQAGKNVRGTLQLEGSVIAAGKDVFLANRVGEGFAIVKNAGPGVDILQGGRRIARSNSKGRALLSSLEAFNETRVAIDPASLPAGLEAENGTDFRIVTRRRRAALVDFGVRKVNAAIVVIKGPDGKPVPPGTVVNRSDGEAGLMGYDGEVFLKDLKASNRVMIDLGAAGKCTASFSYNVDGEAQPVIGPITCS